MAEGIYQAMALVMAEIGQVDKGRQSKSDWKYRGVDDLYNALHPVLAKHGVFVLPQAGDIERMEKATKAGGAIEVVTVRVAYRFCHADGSSVECSSLGQAMDSGDKALAKALAMASKYALLQTFCIPTEADDNGACASSFPGSFPQNGSPSPGGGQPMITPEQERALRPLLGGDRSRAIETVQSIIGRRVQAMSEITRQEASQCIGALRRAAQ